MVEAERRRRDACARYEAVGRLDARDAAQRRRTADRPPGIRADAAKNHPRCDRRAGAAAAAGSEMAGVPGVARRRLRQVEGRSAIGEFMRRQFAGSAPNRRRRRAVRRRPRRCRRCRPAGSSTAGIREPLVSTMSLSPIGMPCNGPRGPPDMIAASAARASASARSSVRCTKACRVSSCRCTRSRQAWSIRPATISWLRDSPRRLGDGRDRRGHRRSSSVKP